MSAEIIHKGSGVLGNAPLPTDLELQELAVNYNAGDPALYLKDSAGVIRRIGGKASTSAVGAVQLTNALDSTSELLAPTAKALADVNDDLQDFKNALAYTKRLYVNLEGDDAADGDSPATALRTLRRAAELSTAGTAILVQAGVYVEVCPIVVPRQVGIFGDSLRQVTILPTEDTKFDGIFEVDSGFYCFGCTFTGHQQGTHNGVYKTSFVVQFNATANNLAFGASTFGAYITRSPYIQNCTSLTARQDGGPGGSVSTGVTGGGLLIDGAACASNSPLRSIVVDSFTQVNLGGPGCLIKNDGFAQLVSFFSTFCEYHVRCETGGQASISASTTNFGTFGLVSDGYSAAPVFSGTANGSTTSYVNVINLSSPRFGSSARPLPGLLLQVGSSFYTVTGSVALTDGTVGYRVNFFPALDQAIPQGTTISFVRRSQISTGGHNMEYVGAGTNYNALPENGGVPIPANETVETNKGRVFFSSFDHLGNLRVGKGFDVDGATGNVTISTDQFNLAGLNFIGPFKRNGIFVGEQLQEVSNDVNLVSTATGNADGNAVPTQYAVQQFLTTNYQPKLLSGSNIRPLKSGTTEASLLGSDFIYLPRLINGTVEKPLLSDQDIQFKTINGQQIIGAGDLVIAGGGEGGGSAIFRSSTALTTESATSEETITGTLTLPKSAVLLSIQLSRAAWFRLYNAASASTSDALRIRTNDPLPGRGVVTEVIAETASTTVLAPTVNANNMEATPSTDYPYRITNDGASGTITITITYLLLEA